MANFDDIQSRIYNLKIKSPINESLSLSDIFDSISNKSDIGYVLSKASYQQINTNNLLEKACNTIIDSDISIQEQKQITDSLFRLLPYVEQVKKYKRVLNELSTKFNNKGLEDTVKTLIECDRIINNQDKLQKYSNFKRIFENYYITEDIETIVIESCDIIDSYKMKYETKVNVALENIIYNMDLLKEEYDKKDVVELIYEYFCNNKDFKKENIDKVLKESSIELNNQYIESIIEGKTFNKTKQYFKDLVRNGSVTKETIQNVIKKVYIEDSTNIIEDLPNLLSCVKFVLILGIASVNLPIGIIVGIADHIISIKLNRVDIEKAIKCYKKEKSKIENKKYSVSNSATVKKYEQIDKEYDKSIEKLEMYRETLYSDKENEDRMMSEASENDFNHLDAEFRTLCETVENYINNSNIETLVYEYINNIDDSKEVNNLFSALSESNIINRNMIDIDNVYSTLDNPKITGSLINNISKFKVSQVSEDTDCFEEMIYYNNMYKILSENSFTAKAKLLAINAKKKSQGLTDKEKLLSDQIDSTYDRMRDKLNTKSTNQNREAVIKGSILPSLSSLIKLVAGSYLVGALVNPLLGIIGFVGGIALSKKATDKERKYILDELDIQLEVVEKKVSLAENNNDMKSYEQLLRIQKRLKQEKQRIIYRGEARNYYATKSKD